jgi:hypothetical protein
MQISFHEIEDHVKIFIILRLDNVEESNYVFITIQFLKEHDLPEGSLSISGVVEGVKDLFERDNLFNDQEPKYTYLSFLSIAFHTIPSAPFPNF